MKAPLDAAREKLRVAVADAEAMHNGARLADYAAEIRLLLAPEAGKLSPQEGYRAGIRAAAAFAGEWDSQIACLYRFADVILCKFNLRAGQPRRKRGPRANRRPLKKSTP
jgi:hypothetical protein